LISTRPPDGDEAELLFTIVMFQIVAALYQNSVISPELYHLLVRGIHFCSKTRSLTELAELFTEIWNRIRAVRNFRLCYDALDVTLKCFVALPQIQGIDCRSFLTFFENQESHCPEIYPRFAESILDMRQRLHPLTAEADAIASFFSFRVPRLDEFVLRIYALFSFDESPELATNFFHDLPPCITELVNQSPPRFRFEKIDGQVAAATVPPFTFAELDTPSRFLNGFDHWQSELLLTDFVQAIPSQLRGVADTVATTFETVIKEFLLSFQEHLMLVTGERCFWDIMAVFLHITNSVREHQVIEKLAKSLFLPALFHPSQTVFGPEVAPRELRLLRLAMWKTIERRSHLVLRLFIFHSGHAFLFAELLTYPEDRQLFYNLEYMKMIADCSVMLQEADLHHHSDLTERARSSTFSILGEVFAETFDAFAYFEDVMRFVFEKSIRRPLIGLYRAGIGTQKNCFLVDSIVRFVQSTVENGFTEIGWELLRITSKLFEGRVVGQSQFLGFFEVLMQFLDAHPSAEVLDLALHNFGRCRQPKGRHLKALDNAMRQLQVQLPMSQVLLFLGKPENLPLHRRGYIILRPQFLLVLAVHYGFTRAVLAVLCQLAGYSLRNAHLMHDFCIDSFLLAHINGQPARYQDEAFDIKLFDQELGISLLKLICQEKISYSIISGFFGSNAMLRLLLSMAT
jgi:hypothetical protein